MLATILPLGVTHRVYGQVNDNGVRYAIIQVNSIRSPLSYVFGIGNNGDVIGADAHGIAGFDWNDGRLSVLWGINRDVGANPYDVNADHVVAGSSRGILYNTVEATVWFNGNSPIGIGTLGGEASDAYGINDVNHVVGDAQVYDGSYHAFLWQDGVMEDLGTLGAYSSFAWGINNLDQVVGHSAFETGGKQAFIWQDGVMTPLGTLGGYESQAWDINDLSQVVGYADDEQNHDVAFLWQDGVMQNIHDYQFGSYSEAKGINNHTQVVGLIVGNGSLQRDTFIWDPVNGMHNIEEYLPPDNPWDLTYAYDINDAGQIAGYGTRNRFQYGYMITPVTPTLHMDDPSSFQAGTDVTFTIHNADPGKTVHFIYGRVGGGYLIPGCNSPTGAVLQMDDPTVIGTAAADANGDASITAFVPLAARNAGDILLQAVEQSQCKITQLVVVRFQ